MTFAINYFIHYSAIILSDSIELPILTRYKEAINKKYDDN